MINDDNVEIFDQKVFKKSQKTQPCKTSQVFYAWLLKWDKQGPRGSRGSEGDDGDQWEVSITIVKMLESLGFQKYGTCRL